jgi:hypothetical protein
MVFYLRIEGLNRDFGRTYNAAMSTIAIGDIHGNRDALDDLLDRLTASVDICVDMEKGGPIVPA